MTPPDVDRCVAELALEIHQAICAPANEYKQMTGVIRNTLTNSPHIRALRQGGGWIPVSERLPEFTNWDKSGSAEVAVLTEDGKVLAAYWKSNAYAKTERGRAPRWERNHAAILGANVIAWQPLPAPPSPAKEG